MYVPRVWCTCFELWRTCALCQQADQTYAIRLCQLIVWYANHWLIQSSSSPEFHFKAASVVLDFTIDPISFAVTMKYHYASIKFFLDEFIMIKSVLIDGWCWLIELWSFTVPPRPQLLAAADTRQPARTVPSLVQPSRLDRISALKICFTRSTFLLCSCFNFRYTEVVPCTYTHREFRKIS